MRIYLNFENPSQTSAKLTKSANKFFITIPKPDRFNIVKIRETLYYQSSIDKSSYLNILANGNFVQQLTSENGENTITIPKKYFRQDYNSVGVQSFHKSPDSWIQIDLSKSYIDIYFQLKEFEERLSSIYRYMFDTKNIYRDSINFVFPKLPTEQDLTNYGIVANAIGNILKFRYINFYVSTSISDSMNNIVIGSWKKIRGILQKHIDIKKFDEVAKKGIGTIGVYRNRNNPSKGILVIGGKDTKEIEKAIYKLFDKNLEIYDQQYISIASKEIEIEKAQPYTAPKFAPFGKKIYFRDLGLSSLTFVGKGNFNISYKLNIYPSFKFDNSNIGMRLKYFSSDIAGVDRIFNISINDMFVYQYSDEYLSQKESYRDTGEFGFPANILNGGGKFNFNIEISSLLKDPSIEPSDIKFTLRDDSYIVLPKGKSYIELPELKYIMESSFPFSIYPDLQDTGIVITDFHSQTIASAMFLAFKLGMDIQSPGYFLKLTYDINSVKDKNIILVGKEIRNYGAIYEKAPIQFTKGGIIRRGYDKKTRKSFQYREDIDLSNFVIAQTYQSLFDPKKIVFEVTALSPKVLYIGVHKGFTPDNSWSFKGDIWFYNVESEKAYSYQFQRKYIVENIESEDNNQSISVEEL